MNTFALLVMTDGRNNYLLQTVSSASLMLRGPIIERWMHDDTGDENHRAWLRRRFPDFIHIGEGPRKGFGGAYDFVWKTLGGQSQAKYVFSLEDDFTFNREIPLEAMAQVLEDNPHVYQMALRRQAWSSEEIQAGGVIERWPDVFYQQDGWISQRFFYTTNPHLCRKSLFETRTYPNVKDAEGHFSLGVLNDDPQAQFGYWGEKSDPPWVQHIGVQRSTGTY